MRFEKVTQRVYLFYGGIEVYEKRRHPFLTGYRLREDGNIASFSGAKQAFARMNLKPRILFLETSLVRFHLYCIRE